MDKQKEVLFDIYCKLCQHYRKAESDDPCDSCLAEPANINSHEPLYFIERGRSKNGKNKHSRR